MKTNPSLTGVLPKIFNRDNVDQRRLGELVDLISDARFTGHGDKTARDVLGEVYEYFLEKFARAEGKRGGEFYTPASVVKLLVEVLEPYSGPGLRPVLRFRRHVRPGREVRPRPRRPPRRHRRLRPGVQRAHLAPGQDEPRHPRHRRRPRPAAGRTPSTPTSTPTSRPTSSSPTRRSTCPTGRGETDDPRWRYGVPPGGQRELRLAPAHRLQARAHGSAGVVLANGSMSSKQSGEGEIRAAMVEADLVACMIALPPQLFRTTADPGLPLVLRQGQGPAGREAPDRPPRRGPVHRRPRRWARWSTAPSASSPTTTSPRSPAPTTPGAAPPRAREAGLKYEDIPGFCYSADLEEIRKHDHVLTPGRYVGAAEADDGDDEPIAEKIDRLTKELFAHFDESARLEQVVRDQLERLDV